MKRLLVFIAFLSSACYGQARFYSGQHGLPLIPRIGLVNLSNNATTAKIANADDANTLPWPFDVQYASAVSGLTKSSTVGSRFGTGSAYKFFTDKAQSDAPGGLGCRSELWMISDAAGTTGLGYQDFEKWIGFSAYIPSSWTNETNDNIYHILHQWHDNCFSYPGETELKSAFEFVIWKGKWSFVTRSNLSATGSIQNEITPAMGVRMNLSDPTVTKDVWHDIVLHLIFKNGAASNPTANQATVEIWIDGVKCANYVPGSGLYMGYNHTQPPFFKIGNYSFMWNPENYASYTGFEVQPTKTHYVDNVRVGSSSSNYYSVFPGNYP